MNDELQNKLAEVLGGIAEGVTQAKDFAVEQLPDVAQQYIMFGMVWETAAFVMLVAATVVCGWMVLRGWKLWSDDESSHQDADRGQMMMMFGSIPGVVFAIFCLAQLKAVLLVWFAPKLYLLQGIAGLVK
jgi:hypothetical protein